MPSEKELAARQRHRATDKARRKAGTHTAYYILHDSRKSDRKKGLENDLTQEIVQALIGQPCTACGDMESKMSLDRIDNTLGHTQANVLPCCYRCNMIRRHMPFEAWRQLFPVLRSVRESGAFGDWLSKSPLQG